MRLALAAVLLLSASPAWAGPPTAQQLITAYHQADEGCRGNPGEKADAECYRRTRLNSRLNQIGWCYGTKTQSRASFEWHRCTANSLSSDDLTTDSHN